MIHGSVGDMGTVQNVTPQFQVKSNSLDADYADKFEPPLFH
jgi:ribosomal protein S30